MKAKESKSRRWLLDHEVEVQSGGRWTASRLRKDRMKAQLFPFHRIGRNCYYDLDEIDGVVEGSRHGGKVAA